MNPEGGGQIGMVQTRWTYLNSDYSLLTNVETILLDGHFVVEHGARSRRGTFFNFNGTAGVWRRKAMTMPRLGARHAHRRHRPFLSLAAQRLEIPLPAAYRVRVRASRGHERLQSPAGTMGQGLMQTAKKILPKVLKSDAPWHVKTEAFFHLTGNISYPLMILLSTMLLPAMIVRSIRAGSRCW